VEDCSCALWVVAMQCDGSQLCEVVDCSCGMRYNPA